MKDTIFVRIHSIDNTTHVLMEVTQDELELLNILEDTKVLTFEITE